MPRKLKGLGLAVLMLLLVATAACNQAEKQAAAEQAARDAQWAELQQKKADLDTARQQHSELQASLEAAEEEGEEDAGEEVEAEAGDGMEDPAANLAQLQAEVNDASEAFSNALVEFINANPLIEGEEPTERQKEAIRMKSAEDMMVAEEYISMGGNYKRAISIYEAALMVDPDNEDLIAALADAEANRYMSQERFDQVDNGMTQDEVRELLGTPYHANVREFPEDRVIAWFYPVNAGGSAAAVYFRARREGAEYTVYEADFEEVVKEGPTVVGEDGEDGEGEEG